MLTFSLWAAAPGMGGSLRWPGVGLLLIGGLLLVDGYRLRQVAGPAPVINSNS